MVALIERKASKAIADSIPKYGRCTEGFPERKLINAGKDIRRKDWSRGAHGNHHHHSHGGFGDHGDGLYILVRCHALSPFLV